MRKTSNRYFHHFDYHLLEPPPDTPRTVTCLKCGQTYSTRGISHGWCFTCYKKYGDLRHQLKSRMATSPRVMRWLAEGELESNQLIPWGMI